VQLGIQRRLQYRGIDVVVVNFCPALKKNIEPAEADPKVKIDD